MVDTIYALSSGSPPAAIAIIRMSGPATENALKALAGSLPEPRRAAARVLKNGDGAVLDHALVLWIPGSKTVTGEDVGELHLHGGRAVVAAVKTALGALPGLRAAEAGEFTRRAFANGRIDLAEAEGLADLLSAETELQRQSAVALASGAFSTQVGAWREKLLRLSSLVEAALDFSDEDDVPYLPDAFGNQIDELTDELAAWLNQPRSEVLKEGFRVVLAGPPNTGKSSLFNALLEDEAAIIAETAGTTRDVLERSISLKGIPFAFVD
ncbi:MAG: GTPase, partial [Pontixanthobacter sp.]